jgi:hypothetical protein
VVEGSSGGERTLIAPVLSCVSMVPFAEMCSGMRPLTIFPDHAWYKMLWDSSWRSSLGVGQHRFREVCKARERGQQMLGAELRGVNSTG